MHELMKLLAIYWAVSGLWIIQKIKSISKFQREIPKMHIWIFIYKYSFIFLPDWQRRL